MSVLVPQFGVEGTLRIHDEPDENDLEQVEVEDTVFDDKKMTLATPKGTFSMFQHLRVRITIERRRFGRNRVSIVLASDTSKKRKLN